MTMWTRCLPLYLGVVLFVAVRPRLPAATGDDKQDKELATWKEKLKPLSDDLLAIYYEASKIHAEKGTDGYYTIEGVVKQLDCPPPKAVMDDIKERLKEYKPGRMPKADVFSGRGKGEGSSAVNASTVWQQAIKKIKWKK